jgi:hypothetical protein
VGALWGRDTNMLKDVVALEDNWDGEGAPKPSPDALARAADVLRWAESREVEVLDVDADVLGGVAVYVRTVDVSTRAVLVWLACMNSGLTTAVWSMGDAGTGSALIPSAEPIDMDQLLASIMAESTSETATEPA